MKHHVNFTPGPSQLYFTVADHARTAFREGIPSLSHRTKAFENIVAEANEGLKALLGIPSNFHIFYTSSATEIWERTIENLVEESSLHFVNGSFSKRFHEIALQLNKKAVKAEVEPGKGFSMTDIEKIGEAELIALTHNETSTGVSLPAEFINTFRTRYPDSLVVVDAVSSLPYPKFDYAAIDSAFFSVQKGFGLPAGLGVWIVNEKAIEKSERLVRKGLSIGSYHSLPQLKTHGLKNQTPETPNVLGIYLLSKVVGDLLRRGADTIRRETEYKAAILYQALKSSSLISPFVTQPELQSKTVIVANCSNHTERLTQHLQKHGLFPGDGYGTYKSTQLRFANFPAHSKEQYELLVDTVATFQ